MRYETSINEGGAFRDAVGAADVQESEKDICQTITTKDYDGRAAY